jgi:glycosyltransferase involved in cell wall biosynthesis
MKKTVGVVLATFNGEAFLDEQLTSIFKQTILPDTVVIVDDCSADGSFRIAEEWAARHQGIIKLHANDKNIGFIQNFERGISLCDTDYIALCDQDDIWHSDKLQKCIAQLSTDDSTGLCYHNVNLINVAGESIGADLRALTKLDLPLDKSYIQKLVVSDQRSPIPGCSIVFNKKLKSYFLPIPGEKSCPHDWWLCAISFFLFNPIYIEEPLVKYRIHKNQTSGPSSTLLKGTIYAAKKKITIKRIISNIKKEITRTFNHHNKRRERESYKIKQNNDLNSAVERLNFFIASINSANNMPATKINIIPAEPQPAPASAAGSAKSL